MSRAAHATLIFFAFTSYDLTASTTFEKLNQCVEQKDRACILACLKDAPAGRSANDFALLARAHMLLGQNQEAIDSIRRANELAPGNFGYLMDQGWIYQRSGDQIDAIRSFLLASKIEPHSPQVFYELGMSFFLSQEYERATRHFEETLRLDPKQDKAEFMLGVVAIWSDHLQEAKVDFVNALKLKPNNAQYLLHYGVLLAKLNEMDLALSQFAGSAAVGSVESLDALSAWEALSRDEEISRGSRRAGGGSSVAADFFNGFLPVG